MRTKCLTNDGVNVTTVAALLEEIAVVESVANIAGERQAAIDHVLAGISKLQNEVADAAEFTPAYDRKQYSEVTFLISFYSHPAMNLPLPPSL